MSSDEYILANGFYCNPKLINGKKEGVAEEITKDDQIIASLNIENEKFNSVCQFYTDG